MGKLLVLILLVVAAVWLVRRAIRRGSPAEQAPKQEQAPKPQASEELVRCAHCGLLLPRGEARQAGGAIYCSEEHATSTEKRGPGR
jgi:uncharacterized protein